MIKRTKLLTALLFLTCLYSTSSFSLNLNTRPDIQSYIQWLNARYQFNTAQLSVWFSQLRFNTALLQKKVSHAKAMTWADYRKAVVTPARIQQGIRFWQDNAQALQAAAQQYGIPESVIVGIIGVETAYGENQGHFSVFNTLSTLAFTPNRRATYFRSELTHFLLIAREAGWSTLEVQGSYAGALGLPQFMPSSYRLYAIDARHKGYADLFHDSSDAIYSVAYYLNQKGWHPAEPAILPAKLASMPNKNVLYALNTRPKLTLSQLRALGLTTTTPVSNTMKAGFLTLGKPAQLWLTGHNFSVIKTYNASDFYAMAVLELGTQVALTR